MRGRGGAGAWRVPSRGRGRVSASSRPGVSLSVRAGCQYFKIPIIFHFTTREFAAGASIDTDRRPDSVPRQQHSTISSYVLSSLVYSTQLGKSLPSHLHSPAGSFGPASRLHSDALPIDSPVPHRPRALHVLPCAPNVRPVALKPYLASRSVRYSRNMPCGSAVIGIHSRRALTPF